MREEQYRRQEDIFVCSHSTLVLAINLAFINTQITSAGVNVRDAAVDAFQNFPRHTFGQLTMSTWYLRPRIFSKHAQNVLPPDSARLHI